MEQGQLRPYDGEIQIIFAESRVHLLKAQRRRLGGNRTGFTVIAAAYAVIPRGDRFFRNRAFRP